MRDVMARALCAAMVVTFPATANESAGDDATKAAPPPPAELPATVAPATTATTTTTTTTTEAPAPTAPAATATAGTPAASPTTGDADPATAPAAAATTAGEPAEAGGGGEELNLDDLQKAAARELLNGETKVASSTAQRLRDTPGVITVITRDDIRRLAPRDLLDLLHLVPGFAFGVDVQGSVGPIFRGVWGQEGKVLVLWDGFEINETMYLTAPMQNHFPLQSIDRIEIIRGPGSAQYGGYAELAVINIIPRGAAVQGMEAVATYGQMSEIFGRANGELLYGQKIAGGALDGLELSVNAFGGEAAQSNRLYNDGAGSEYVMDWNNQRQGPTWLEASARWGALQVRGLLDVFRVAQRDGYDASLPAAINNSFYGAHIDVRYTIRASDTVEIEPRLNFKRQLPWFAGGAFLEYVPSENLYYKTADRMRFVLPVKWTFMPGFVINSGLDAYADQAAVTLSPDGGYEGINVPFQNGEASIAYGNVGAFVDLSVQHEIANLTLGARYEFNSAAGSSFVPRFAATRSFGPLWVKMLLSGAFKPPGVENFVLNPGILPENAVVYEAEVGYSFTDTIAASATVFRNELTRPIVYGYDATVNTETYANFNKTGSQGLEAELRMLEEWGSIDANYSFTNSDGLNDVASYETGRRGSLRAVPAHKATVAARLNVTPNLSAGPTLVVLSERRGWLGAANNVVEATTPTVLASFAMFYRDLLVDGVDASLAVHNILDTDYRYIQPYDGGHAPLPAAGREYLLRLSYRFGL